MIFDVCREACINFKELWKKKHADDLWIKEVAAMQSCLPSAISFSGTSGIVLANDMIAHDQVNENNSSNDSTPAEETSNSATSNKKEGNLLLVFHFPLPYYILHILEIYKK